MRKTILFIAFSFILFSCQKEVKPTSENMASIINSNKYKITINIVGGNIAGSYKDQLIIRIDDYQLDSKSECEKSSKKTKHKRERFFKQYFKKIS